MQDFLEQVSSLVKNEKLRQTIKTNAKQYIETNYSETTEHQGYFELSTSMNKSKKLDEIDQSDLLELHRQALQPEEETSKPIDAPPVTYDAGCTGKPNGTASEGAQSSKSQSAEQNLETSQGESENKNKKAKTKSKSKGKRSSRVVDVHAMPPEGEKETFDTSKTFGTTDLVVDSNKQQTSKTEGEIMKKTVSMEPPPAKPLPNPSANVTAANKTSPPGACDNVLCFCDSEIRHYCVRSSENYQPVSGNTNMKQ